MAIIFQNTIRLPILIFVKKIFISNNYNKKSIMTTRVKFEKVLENLEKNPFFEKYANKIAKLQQTSPEEFLQRVKNQEKLQKKKGTIITVYYTILNKNQLIYLVV